MSDLVSIDNQNVDQNEAVEPKFAELELVYWGEAYRWGQVRKKKNGKVVKECVIIIQNDNQNNIYEETVALLCTTDNEERARIDYSFRLNYEVMPDYNLQRLENYAGCDFFVKRLILVNRGRIGRYLGTFDSTFMNTLQPIIDYFFGLKRTKNVSKSQIKILSQVNVKDLIDISETSSSKKRKILRCLDLFGFDISKNGVQYVKDAIYIASELDEYKLEVLARIIAEKDNADKDEVLRLIIARIKETLGLKKIHSIEFIRLIASIMRDE